MKRYLFNGAACPLFYWLTVAILIATSPSLRAADKSLDEELMESLDSELLEGLETIPPDEAAEPTKDGDAAPSDVATSDEDTFTRISKRMREAERLISKTEAAKTTKKVQKEIVTDLDKLISELEKQCQKCQGGSSSTSKSQQTAQRDRVKQPKQKGGDGQHDSKNPAQDATERLGKDEARKAQLARMKSMLQKEDIWGELPPKAREQLMQLSPEQFLPKYELLIEEYYKRLAEQPAK